MNGFRPAALRRSLSRPHRGICSLSTAALVLLLPLTGCLVSTHAVDKIEIAPNVQTATLDELLKKLETQYAAVDTLNLRVNITPTEGGAHRGEVKQISSFAGYILLRKPADLNVIMLLPFVRSEALDMVSDGKDFKLVIPPQSRAITGSETVTKPEANGLYNLRPNDIRVALQIPPVAPDDFVSLTLHSRLLPRAGGRKTDIEEPDYDLAVLKPIDSVRGGHNLQRERVIHFSRVTLLPYELDLYNADGQIVETVTFDKYQKFGDVDYPMSIHISRPLNEYTLQIDINKLILNQQMDDEQFKLPIPEGFKITKM